MKDFFRKQIHIPGLNRAEAAIQKFTIGERWLFYTLAAIMVGSGLLLIVKVGNLFSVTIPAHGGTFIEGIVGSPRFINPLLAVSDADRDLSALVFSGLLRANTDGALVPDLAEKYEISPDGLTYTVTIKNNARFHDGEPLTADDVIFTIEKARDPAIKSIKRAEWEGVTAEKVNDRVVTFHLLKPYYPFIENLTLGIIPKHLWKDGSAEEFSFSLKNINPVGSGPFKINKIVKNDKGIPTEYALVSFSKYASGEPYLNNIYIKLYPSEQDLLNAWKWGNIDSMGGISPNKTDSLNNAGAKIETLKLPRVYGVFLNQNQAAIFADKAVRRALDEAVDKNKLVKNVLHGYGSVLDGPLPLDVLGASGQSDANDSQRAASSTDRIAKARNMLAKAGWALNKNTNVLEKIVKTKKGNTVSTLSFSISAPNVPELKEAADFVSDSWNALGAKTEVKLFELSDLSQNVIRPRKYDALLFGQVIGRNPDMFAFWHSSQRNDPGYNIALYANSKVDKLLNDAREVRNQDDQDAIVKKIYSEINNDTPAIFLYTPDYLYVIPKDMKGFKGGFIASPPERFADIASWYTKEDRVWKIFAPQK
jgi:peptide/nickel transport system substrate-binding protein